MKSIYEDEFGERLKELASEYQLTRIKIEKPQARQDWKQDPDTLRFRLASNKVVVRSGSRYHTAEVAAGQDPYDVYNETETAMRNKISEANKRYREANRDKLLKAQRVAQKRYRDNAREDKQAVARQGQ